MKRRFFGALISFCMVCSLLSVDAALAAPSFPDMPPEDHWAYGALVGAVENGLLRGDDVGLRPRDTLTRAELAVVVNRAFGAIETSDLSDFVDLDESSWYWEDMGKAKRMGVFLGSDDGTMRPDHPITREEAFTVLARSLRLSDGDPSVLGTHLDGTLVSDWAVPSLSAMVTAGYIQGSDAKLNPQGLVTREEFAQVMQNLFAHYVRESGIYTDSVSGNLLVRSGDVILDGIVVPADLIIGEGVGDGDVTLRNVKVAGRLLVRGGGEDSVVITNTSEVGSIIVAKTGDGGVRVRTEEGCRVDVVYVDDGSSDVILQGTFNQVTVSASSPVLLLDATITGLTMSGAGSTVTLSGSTTVTAAMIPESAVGSQLQVESGAVIAKVESAAQGVAIKGKGTVRQALVSGDDTSVLTLGTTVIAAEGTKGVTVGGVPAGTGTPWVDPGEEEPSTHAAAVTTLGELQAALSDHAVSSITIRAAIDVPVGTTVTFTKPVTVADLPGSILTVEGELVNNSTFVNRGLGSIFEDTGLLILGTFTNNGTFESCTRFGLSDASFTNNGTVENKGWLHAGGAVITNNGVFRSIGDISLLNFGSFEADAEVPSTFTNSAGATFASEGPGGMLLRLTSTFTNQGSATVTGYLDNYGTVENTGAFTYAGWVLNAGSVVGTLTPCGDDAAIENDVPVATLAELTAQLDSLESGYDGIAIVGEIALVGDLTVGEHARLGPDGTFVVPEGTTLTITSVSGYNGLDVSGKLELAGALVTTRSGSGDDECVGQVTLLGGILRATGAYTIENHGAIVYFGGDLEPKDIVVNGNPIIFPLKFASVADEASLRWAMDDPVVEVIAIEAGLAITSDLEIKKNVTVMDPHTLSIPSGVTVTLKDGGRLAVEGTVESGGAIVNEGSSEGVFVDSTGEFLNTGVLFVRSRFDVWEGTFVNEGSVSIDAGHTLLARGAILENSGTFANYGSLDMGSSAGLDGAPCGRGTTFTNTGTFANGPLGTPASFAYLGMIWGEFHNTGDFVNNGNMDLRYTDFAHSGGTFTTYNSAGFTITGGSFSTEGAEAGSFSNEGYMRIADEYGLGGGDAICDVVLGTHTLKDDSNWLDYAASVYSESGLLAAEAAQAAKKGILGDGVDYFGFATYNRLNFMADIALGSNVDLSAFQSYWVEDYWVWDEGTEREVEVRVLLSVGSGTTLTVGNDSCLNIHGILGNHGTIITAAPYDDGDTHFDGGCIEIWPMGAFTNYSDGTVEHNGNLLIRHEFLSADDVLRPQVTGIDTIPVTFVALVHDEAAFLVANESSVPEYGSIEIKGDSIVHLACEGTITVDKDLFIEPGSGLIVAYGQTLCFTGNHWIKNAGDMSVYGEMTIGGGASFRNQQHLEIGLVTGGDMALVTVESDGFMQNDGDITIYAGGTLDVAKDQYEGWPPRLPGGDT